MITENDLYEEANRFLEEHYDMLLTIPIKINKEFITEQGAFEHTKFGVPIAIHIAQFVLDFADDDVVYDVLHHELVHFVLFCKGEPFFDGHPVFETELNRLGVSSTKSGYLGRYHVYQCHGCSKDIVTPRYVTDTTGLVSVCCDATFSHTGRQHIYTGKRRIY